jgi:hypothetical protein
MLTVQDLHETLEDPRHGGWGYACVARTFTANKCAAIDKAIVAVANKEGLTKEELFVWSDSKFGRWLRDEAEETRDITQKFVRKHLNRSIVDRLAKELA